jgi:uroporphyrin-III C-methyltransferase
MPAVGHVSLVGAGPGDPELLTRKAIARLRAADLVLYDALIDSRVLKFARRAQTFFVGKRAGRHALSQADINALLVRAARRGRRVVRLKGGDPFVFGRGGEEAMALTRAGIAFDVVPGVSNAVAAPALAGIPVTHRGLASAFVVASGHDLDAFRATVGGLPPNAATLVVLMGIGRAAEIGADLIARGWPANTPAAIVTDASRETQQTWRGTLDDLARASHDQDNDGPGTIVIGAVARLRCHVPVPGAGASASASASASADSGVALEADRRRETGSGA